MILKECLWIVVPKYELVVVLRPILVRIILQFILGVHVVNEN